MLKIKSTLLFISLLLFIFPLANAQNNVPIHPIDRDYIKEWLILGPFFPYDLDMDFLAEIGGEANSNPEEGDSIILKNGSSLQWKHYQSIKNIIDLRDALGRNQNATAYAFCNLKTDVEGKHKILLDSEDGVAVWINGKKVHDNPDTRYLFLNHDSFEIDLKEGINRCLVKVSIGTGKWRFAMRAFPPDQQLVAQPKFVLSSDVLKEKTFLYNIQWKYHSGDNVKWAKPDFDDNNWELVYPELYANGLPKDGWQGVGWFRLHIEVDSSIMKKPLGLSDGFEEMFNPQNELLGSEQVKKLFNDVAENSPEEIIEYLKNAGEVWANGRDQEDDVTFVVIKIE